MPGSLKVATYFISISAYLDEMMNFSPVFMILSLKAGQLSASIGGNTVIPGIMSKFVFF